MDKGKDFIIGFVLGAAVGAVTALLLAPQSGVETRKMIAAKGQELFERTKERTDQVVQEVKTVSEKAIKEIQSRAEQVIEKAKQVLESAKRAQSTNMSSDQAQEGSSEATA